VYRYICSLNVQIGIYNKNVSFYKGSEEEENEEEGSEEEGEPADGEDDDESLS